MTAHGACREFVNSLAPVQSPNGLTVGKAYVGIKENLHVFWMLVIPAACDYTKCRPFIRPLLPFLLFMYFIPVGHRQKNFLHFAYSINVRTLMSALTLNYHSEIIPRLDLWKWTTEYRVRGFIMISYLRTTPQCIAVWRCTADNLHLITCIT